MKWGLDVFCRWEDWGVDSLNDFVKVLRLVRKEERVFLGERCLSRGLEGGVGIVCRFGIEVFFEESKEVKD